MAEVRSSFLIVALLLMLAALAPTRAQAVPDPLACTGYPEPRTFLETQSWWEPVPTLGGQGHVHMGVCWPHGQTVSGIVRLDFVALFHNNVGRITQFKVQDDRSTDYTLNVNIAVNAATQDVQVVRTMNIDTRRQPDGMRQWRLYVYFAHNGGNSQRTKGMYMVDVENRPTGPESGPRYSEYGGAGWYKEADGTDWGYQTADVESSHPAIGSCVLGDWEVEVDLDQSGTTEYFVTIDPHFHDGDPGQVIVSGLGGFEGDVSIDTTLLTNGVHRFVAQSARRVGNEENGGVFSMPFTVCNT